MQSKQGEHLVAFDHGAGFIAQQAAITIAIMRYAQTSPGGAHFIC